MNHSLFFTNSFAGDFFEIKNLLLHLMNRFPEGIIDFVDFDHIRMMQGKYTHPVHKDASLVPFLLLLAMHMLAPLGKVIIPNIPFYTSGLLDKNGISIVILEYFFVELIPANMVGTVSPLFAAGDRVCSKENGLGLGVLPSKEKAFLLLTRRGMSV